MNLNLLKIASCSLLIGASFQAHAQTPASYAEAVSEMAMKTMWKDNEGRIPHPKNWTYDQSIVLLGVEGLWYRTGDKKYFDYMQKSMDRFVQDDGSIETYKTDSYNIDNIACGRILLALYKVTGKEKYFKAAHIIREQLKSQPRTKQGSFWHKKIYPNQVWLDGLYMAQPFYAEWAVTFKEGDSTFNDIANQFVWIEKHTRDTKTGLMRHAWDESKEMAWADKTTGLAPNVWARAMGWYGAALVDVLEYYPENHPRKKELRAILDRFATAISKAQDKESGLWWDVMNEPYPGKKGNYFEASAASQFVYAIAKGVRLGFIDAKYISTAKAGYKGITERFPIKEADSLWHFNGTVKVSGLGGKPYRDGSFEYYISEPVIQDDAKGVGPFIQASTEMELLSNLEQGKGKTILLDSYYNNEYDKDAFGNKRSNHYKWEERSNGGYQFWAKNFEYRGARLATTYKPASATTLKNASTYIIVDPDIEKENPDAKYMREAEAEAIYNWVNSGGTLVLMLNDSGNCDLDKINILTKKMGFHFNNDSRNHVKGHEFEQGALYIQPGNDIFKTAKKVYLKEISTIVIDDAKKAKSIYEDKGDVLMVTAKIGKGKVFAVGDPWIYNEYVDGRKLPAEFENFKAMEDLTNWILK